LGDETRSALHIQPGCTAAKRAAGRRAGTMQRPALSPERLIEGIRLGDRTLLAKAITLVESSRPDDQKAAERVFRDCPPTTGNTIRVGITGAPGVGKSSLIEALGSYLIIQRSEKVAVLAIDPSSQLSGGSILGDKTRMPFLSSSEMAFIRPSPSRGMHGGLSQHTREAIRLCEAAGYRNVIVETVGVGQSDSSVRAMVDFVMLVTIPGAGDELQGMKRGVMEMANLVVVNKADGDNLHAAERARVGAESALRFLRTSASGWVPRAISCSAHAGRGISDIWSSVLDFVDLATENRWLERMRRDQTRHALYEELEQGLMQMFRADSVVQQRMTELERQVIAGQATTTSATLELLNLFAARVDSGQGKLTMS